MINIIFLNIFWSNKIFIYILIRIKDQMLFQFQKTNSLIFTGWMMANQVSIIFFVAHFYPQGSFTFSHLASRSIIWMDAADCWNLHQTCVSGFCGLATCDIMVIHCQQFWMRQPILQLFFSAQFYQIWIGTYSSKHQFQAQENLP